MEATLWDTLGTQKYMEILIKKIHELEQGHEKKGERDWLQALVTKRNKLK